MEKCPKCKKENIKITLTCLNCGYRNDNYSIRKEKSKKAVLGDNILYKLEDIEINVLKLLLSRITDLRLEYKDLCEIDSILKSLCEDLKEDYNSYFLKLNIIASTQKMKGEAKNEKIK